MIDKKLISKILMSLLLVLMILLVVVIFLETRKTGPTSSEQTPTPTPTPTPIVTRPVSKWATDQGVLTIEAGLKDLSAEIEQTDLKESNLLPPVLDMQVKF